MKTVKFKFCIHDHDQEEQELVLNFDAQELEILNQYLENCERFRGAPLLQNFPVIKNIKLDLNKGSTTFEISDFQYEQVYDFLHRARPLLLHREPASFDKVKKILDKKSKGTNLTKLLKKIGKDYDKGDYQQSFQIYVGEVPEAAKGNPEEWLSKEVDMLINDSNFGSKSSHVPLFHEKTLDTWLNGVEYHQDKDKAEAVKWLEEQLTQDVARGLFVSQLSGKVRSILELEKVSQFILNATNHNQS